MPVHDTVHPKPPRGPDVLIIDDQAAVRSGLILMLTASGLELGEIRTAANSDQAMHQVHANPPAVVLLDVDLGGEDGLALLPTLTLRSEVLVLTSHSDHATIARALAHGARVVLDKRLPGKQVIEALRRLLNLYETHQGYPANAGVSA